MGEESAGYRRFVPPSGRVCWCSVGTRNRRSRRWPALGGSGQCRPGVPEWQPHDYQRKGTTYLFAARHIATGEGVGKGYRHHRAVECKKFLAVMVQSVPETHDGHRILDHYATHKTDRIHNGLRRRPRYSLPFPPTRASWLNQVERWLAEILRRRIRRGTFRRPQAPEGAIRESLQGGRDRRVAVIGCPAMLAEVFGATSRTARRDGLVAVAEQVRRGPSRADSTDEPQESDHDTGDRDPGPDCPLDQAQFKRRKAGLKHIGRHVITLFNCLANGSRDRICLQWRQLGIG